MIIEPTQRTRSGPGFDVETAAATREKDEKRSSIEHYEDVDNASDSVYVVDPDAERRSELFSRSPETASSSLSETKARQEDRRADDHGFDIDVYALLH